MAPDVLSPDEAKAQGMDYQVTLWFHPSRNMETPRGSVGILEWLRGVRSDITRVPGRSAAVVEKPDFHHLAVFANLA